MQCNKVIPIPIAKQLLQVKRNQILKSLDVPLDFEDPYLYDLIEKLTKDCLDIATPNAQFILFDNIQLNKSHEMLVGQELFEINKIIAVALKKSTHLVLFLASAGNKIEEYSKKLIAEGQTLEGLIVDLIGSIIAEQLADIVHNKVISQMHSIGLGTSNRYSPGYCNWPVYDQQKLFRLFKDNTCGIELTESSLMLPIKSVSGIIGVGKNVKLNEYTCAKCSAKACLYRDKNFH